MKYFFASSKNTCIYSPCRELSYRAILRNLKLLTGQRGEKKSFEVLLAGVSSSTIAQFLKVYEPNLEVNIFGVDEFVNVSNLVSSSIVKEKQKFDSIIQKNENGQATAGAANAANVKGHQPFNAESVFGALSEANGKLGKG